MSTPRAEDAVGLQVQPITLGWALKRALIGMLILFVVVWTAAWLLYTSIDPILESQNNDSVTKAAAPITRTSGL